MRPRALPAQPLYLLPRGIARQRQPVLVGGGHVAGRDAAAAERRRQKKNRLRLAARNAEPSQARATQVTQVRAQRDRDAEITSNSSLSKRPLK